MTPKRSRAAASANGKPSNGKYVAIKNGRTTAQMVAAHPHGNKGTPPPEKENRNVLTRNDKRDLITNALISRTQLLQQLIDPRRDFDTECGYPPSILHTAYRMLFDREGIANRVVRVHPEETWVVDPAVTEVDDEVTTEFEAAWNYNCDKWNIWHYLHRIDELSGIGHYGVLLIGVNDGKPLIEPVDGVESGEPQEGRRITFLRAFDESQVRIASYELDKRSPRYGQPKTYLLNFMDILSSDGTNAVEQVVSQQVHWTRCIHVADNRMSSEVIGVPRLRPVFNRIADLRKVLGGSAEMYWRGAFPGYSLETSPDVHGEDVTMDQEAVRDAIESYTNGLERFIGLVGMQVKSLAPQVVDPTSHVEEQLKIIAATIGVPLRIFLGSESGQNAGDQDSDHWDKRIARRQDKYVTPMIIRPFIDRLQLFGVLPVVQSYNVKWPPRSVPTDAENATTCTTLTGALAQYVTTGCDQMVPPLEWLTKFAKFPLPEAQAILQAAYANNGGQQQAPPEGMDGESQYADQGEEDVQPQQGPEQQAPPTGNQSKYERFIGNEFEESEHPRVKGEFANKGRRKMPLKEFNPDEHNDHGTTADFDKKTTSYGHFTDAAKARYPKAGTHVDGHEVLGNIDNKSSIASSLEDYDELPGVREVSMKELQTVRENRKKGVFRSGYAAADDVRRTNELADKIKSSGKISPLIMVDDGHPDGPYILEGGHRIDALEKNGAKSFPAKVVLDWQGIKEHGREGKITPRLIKKQTQNESTMTKDAGQLIETQHYQQPQTYGQYTCPECGEDAAYNGDRESGMMFRGSAVCEECGHHFSAIHKTPVGQVTANMFQESEHPRVKGRWTDKPEHEHAKLREEHLVPLMDHADSTLGEYTPGSTAIQHFVGHGPGAKHDTSGFGFGLMSGRDLEDAYSNSPSERGAKAREEIDAAMHPVRERLRDLYGSHIPLYRTQHAVSKTESAPEVRGVLSWTSDPKFAQHHAGVRNLKPHTDEEIESAVDTFKKTGSVTHKGMHYAPDKNSVEYWGVKATAVHEGDGDYGENSYSHSLDDETPETLRKELKQRQEYRQEKIDGNEKNRKKIIHRMVPVDDVIWATDRAGQQEFIVKNKGKHHIDHTGTPVENMGQGKGRPGRYEESKHVRIKGKFADKPSSKPAPKSKTKEPPPLPPISDMIAKQVESFYEQKQFETSDAQVGKMVSAKREGKGKDALVTTKDGPAPGHITPAMIPPAWKSVKIATDPNADVLVQARDAKGNSKTVYSDNYTMRNQAIKFARIKEGMEKAPQMLEEIQKDRNDPDKVNEADAAWLMMEQATRPGSEADNKGNSHLHGITLTPDNFVLGKVDKQGVPSVVMTVPNQKPMPIKDKKARAEIAKRLQTNGDLHDTGYWLKSHGATTLEGRHVVESPDGVRLQFLGKESVYHDHLIQNPDLAKMLLQRKAQAGESGKLFNTDYKKTTDYVKKLDGGMFTPKDLRTIRGTTLATQHVASMPTPKNREDYISGVMGVADRVSGVLGNDAGICLQAYISPTIFSGWKQSAGV